MAERQCDDEICRTNDPDYPLTMIQQGLTRHGTLDDKKAFSSLVGVALFSEIFSMYSAFQEMIISRRKKL